MYAAFKFLHIIGVVLLLGNVTASAVWKVFANRTRNPAIVAFAQRLVTYTDWSLTLGGVLLVAVGGYGMVVLAGMNPWVGWLLWGQGLFAASGLVWLVKLVPLQIAQARYMARFDAAAQTLDQDYWALCRAWIFWGAVATVPLVIAVYLMVAKP
jgi:uncharacterized membrane protein